jgi:hypothetical protein
MAKASKTTTTAKKKANQTEPKLESIESPKRIATAKTPSRKKKVVASESIASIATKDETKASENLLSHSEQFAAAPWMAARAKLLTNAVTAPDGKLTAVELVEGSQIGPHHCYRRYPFIAGTQYTLSVFVKAAVRTKGVIQLGNGAIAFANPCACTFDLLNKTATKSIAAEAATITGLDNGWFRVSVTATPVATATDAIFASFLSNGVSVNYAGDGKSSLYIWGAQLEIGSAPTDYKPSSAQ